MLDFTDYTFLTATAVLTGFIDAVAGGGGLVMVPALLFSGVPPVQALATNKLQSMFGTGMALWRFGRTGNLKVRRYVPIAGVVMIGAAVGSVAVLAIGTDALEIIVPVLLVCVSLYVLSSPRMTDKDAHTRTSRRAFAPVSFAVGTYDGFFGPGAGSFYTTSLVALRGHGLTRATGLSKLLNCSSNVASVVVFALATKILWGLGLCLAVGAMVGSWIGSHTAIRWGARIIRPLLVILSMMLTARVAWTYFAG